MSRVRSFPLFVLLASDGGSAARSEPALADKRVALVVGNGAYRHVTPLANPANDARLIADTLRSLGFTLIGGRPQLDLDESGFRHVVADFGNALVGADVALFYYAGHGLQVRGANYLVPVDANPVKEADVDFQMLDANLVLRQMESSGTRLNIVILDACRNNPFGGRGLRATGGGLAQMQAPEGTLISFATQPGNVALDGKNGHSPVFARRSPQVLRRPGRDIFRTFNEVGLNREQRDRRRPAALDVEFADQGRFLFCRPAQNGVAAAARGRAGRAGRRGVLGHHQGRESGGPVRGIPGQVSGEPACGRGARPAARHQGGARGARPASGRRRPATGSGRARGAARRRPPIRFTARST